MFSKKLKIIFPIALVSFVIVSSCNPNEVEQDSATALKTDTLNNFLTVNITFQQKTTNQQRQGYLNQLKEFFTSYVSSSADTSKNQSFSAKINESNTDSLHYVYSIAVNRTYALKDSISNPRPNPCPPVGGPRFDEEIGSYTMDCALE